MNNKKITDALVTEDDFIHVKDAISRNAFQALVCELIVREPEIAFGVAERFDHMLTLLEGATMSVRQRAIVQRHLTLLTWTPLLALGRAHRRAWEDFLPSTEVADGSLDGAEGGGE